MKPLSIRHPNRRGRLAGIVAVGAICALLSHAAPVRSSPLARVPAASLPQDYQKIYDDFVRRFKEFMKINDAQEMAKLVAREPDVAVRYADTLCQRLSLEGSSAELEKEINALRIAWKTSMKTSFVEEIYEFVSVRLDARTTKERSRLISEYDKALTRYEANRTGERKLDAFEQSAAEYEALAAAFAEIGDKLNVGRCWTLIGNAWDEQQRGKSANMYRACKAFETALAAYDAIGFRGNVYTELKQRFDSLVANGFNVAEPDPNAPKEGQPEAVVNAAVLTTPLTFEPVADPDAYERPSYFADDVYQAWSALALEGKGSSATVSSLAGGALRVERTGSAQFAVRDASAEPRAPQAVTGNLTIVPATVDDGGVRRDWALLVKSGLQDDQYQSRKTNMAPSDQYLALYYFNGASVIGTIAGTAVRILDDNMDGRYGSLPLTWRYVGLYKETAQPDMDAIVIGDSKRALPWSGVQKIGESWYSLEAVDGGVSLKATPVSLTTGTLRVEFKGEFPTWLVVKGSGVLETAYFDLCADGKKGVDVPVGDYSLFAGLIRRGKKVQTQKVLILPGTSPTWKVEAGKETVIKLGAPYHFEFDVQKGAKEVVVPGAGVRVIGAAGEVYDRAWNCVPEPEVSVRRAGTKKGGKPEAMPKVTGDLDELSEEGKRKYTYYDVWRPMDLKIELKKEGEQVEVQLSEKKNKLFGTIESEWQ